MGFKDELKEFNSVVIAMQENEEREYITDEEAVAAINILSFIKYNKVPDAFLACAAFNLLNVYVRQENNDFSFKFRMHIHNLLKGIEDINQPKAIRVDYDNSDLKLLIVQFWDFQFSFGQVRFDKQIESLLSSKQLKWDGIRKQKCAATIFNFAINSSWLSDETLSGEMLTEKVEKEMEAFHKGNYSIADGRFVKSAELRYANDDMDYYQKNYIREKLFACQDRPVILTAIFRRTWENHVTFVSVKPFIHGVRVIKICDHINLLRSAVERAIDIESLKFGHRYIIIGYCEPYPRGDRMGVKLAINEGFCPIFEVGEYNRMPKDIYSRCHRFNIEEYLDKTQAQLKL